MNLCSNTFCEDNVSADTICVGLSTIFVCFISVHTICVDTGGEDTIEIVDVREFP